MVAPLFVPYAIVASLLLIIISAIFSVINRNKELQLILSSALFAIITILSFYILISNSQATILGTFNFSPFSSFFISLFSFSLLLINLLSYKYSKDYEKFSLLLSFSFVGIFIVPTAINIISIFIGLEIISISTTFIIMLAGKQNFEAAVKFFLLSSISIALFSFAIVLILPYDAQLSLVALSNNPNLSGNSLILLAIIFFAAALAFESAQFPFNLWVPDVYQGSPTNVTALLAGINKKIAFVAIIEIFFVVFAAYHQVFSIIFILLSILTMIFGNLIATVQKNVKRLFAYSSISQAGYIMIGLAATTQFGLEASIFHIFAHAFMIIGAFAIVLWLESKNIKTLDDYNGLNNRSSFVALSLTILMLSMAGIPPLIGFDGKFLLFSSALDSNLAYLAIIGIINSFISIYYYAKVINAMYASKEHSKIKIDTYTKVVVMVTLVLVILLGLYPQPLILAAQAASKTILGS